MEIIVNTNPENEFRFQLLNKISQEIGIEPTTTFGLESFFKLMRFKVSSQIIATFLISSGRELEQMAYKRHCLGDSRYILILFDDDHIMTSKALSLHPRYLAYTQDGFDDVCAVLKKLNQTRDTI